MWAEAQNFLSLTFKNSFYTKKLIYFTIRLSKINVLKCAGSMPNILIVCLNFPKMGLLLQLCFRILQLYVITFASKLIQNKQCCFILANSPYKIWEKYFKEMKAETSAVMTFLFDS